ncbi:hypothetical protein RND81_07G146900 [Saponaria officinalis]|uniref:Uncharacterized protein n=1 Tax=Saponaria officinalis TaxID=3572 RepID=A0AAW1JRF8_SAPOF
MVKNTIFKLSNYRTVQVFLPQFPSLYPPKVSWSSFTSSSKYVNQQSKEDAGGEEDAKVAARIREARQVYEKDDKEAEEVEREYKEMKDKDKDTAHNMKEKAKETAKDATQNVKETIVGKD